MICVQILPARFPPFFAAAARFPPSVFVSSMAEHQVLSPATSSSATTSLEPSTVTPSSTESLLSVFSDSDIKAWLRLLRSVQLGHFRPSGDLLSLTQFNALWWLSSLSENQAQEWLAQRHAVTQADFQEKNATQAVNITDVHPATTLSPTACNEASSTVIPSYTTWSHQTNGVALSDQSQPPFLSEARPCLPHATGLPNGVLKFVTRYWSTAERNPQQFKTFDGFRRHENERERYYIFLPNGVREKSDQGSQCALCLSPNPDDQHFEMHNVLRFIEDTGRPLKRSRKDNFKKLLLTHNVTDEHIDRLVRKWHCTRKKQAYSCGLCIKLFSSLLERTKHLAHDHYEKGQNRDQWDISTLIRGLLLQPDINAEFKKRYALEPSRPDFQLIWAPSAARDLQERLESRNEGSDVLARAAYETATRSTSFASQEVATAYNPFSTETLFYASPSPPTGSRRDFVASTLNPTLQPGHPSNIITDSGHHHDSTEPISESTLLPFPNPSGIRSFDLFVAPSNSNTLQETIPKHPPTIFKEQPAHQAHMTHTSHYNANVGQEHERHAHNASISTGLMDQVVSSSSSSSNNSWQQQLSYHQDPLPLPPPWRGIMPYHEAADHYKVAINDVYSTHTSSTRKRKRSASAEEEEEEDDDDDDADDDHDDEVEDIEDDEDGDDSKSKLLKLERSR